MEQILPSTSTIPGYSSSILVTLPLPDLVNLCRTSKELENKICREDFWEKKVKHDHPFLKDQDEPPEGFESWREYLIHRHMLRKIIKDLIYRWSTVRAIKMGDLDEDADGDDYRASSPTLLFANNQNQDIVLYINRDEYYSPEELERRGGEIDVGYITKDDHAIWGFWERELDQRIPEILEELDGFDVRIIEFTNLSQILAKLDYSVQ